MVTCIWNHVQILTHNTNQQLHCQSLITLNQLYSIHLFAAHLVPHRTDIIHAIYKDDWYFTNFWQHTNIHQTYEASDKCVYVPFVTSYLHDHSHSHISKLKQAIVFYNKLIAVTTQPCRITEIISPAIRGCITNQTN